MRPLGGLRPGVSLPHRFVVLPPEDRSLYRVLMSFFRQDQRRPLPQGVDLNLRAVVMRPRLPYS
jgi:hypothetical protein